MLIFTDELFAKPRRDEAVRYGKRKNTLRNASGHKIEWN